jgi:hypothetical protein
VQENDKLFLYILDPLYTFLLSTIFLILFDFILKFFFKKQDHQLDTFRRFPKGKRSVLIYSIVKEIFNIWNCYLLIFFFPYLTKIVYNSSGLLVCLISFGILYLFQLSISYWVNIIKQKVNYQVGRYPLITFYKLNILQWATANYLLLNIKMIIRSPRMRQQFLVYLLVSVGYFYLVNSLAFLSFFPIRLFLISLIFTLFPLTFNQFLFSAEASFFDHLMTVPDFKKILPAKYILCIFCSFVSFLILLFITPFHWQSLIELTAILLYSAGTITLLSFCGILFVNTKVDLFGSQFKMMINPPSVQAFAILLIYTFSIALVLIIFVLFSSRIAVYFMFIWGGLSIIFSNTWFDFLYKCFYPNKYEKMEIFKIQ